MFMATQWLLRGEYLTWSRTEKSLFFSVLFNLYIVQFTCGVVIRYLPIHTNHNRMWSLNSLMDAYYEKSTQFFEHK